MQCSCGGSTTDHEVVRDLVPVAGFRSCVDCGRAMFLWIDESRIDEFPMAKNARFIVPRQVPQQTMEF